MIKPYYQDDAVTIYHGDCREILPSLETVDLVLADPPYGMSNNTDSSRFSGGHNDSIARRGKGGLFKGKICGDDKPFDPSFLVGFDNVIIWGYNHMACRLPVGTVLVWIKRNDDAFGSFLSDAEIAWKKGGCGVYCRRSFENYTDAKNRIHPNQKPIGIMKWCIGFYPDAITILDPFMGSGTTLRAAKDLNRKAIGIEIEEKYCEMAAQRMMQEVLDFGQPDAPAEVADGKQNTLPL